MNNLKMSLEEATTVAAFRVKLGLSKINVMKPSVKHKKLLRDSSGHCFDKFDISGLPLPVKKHIITAGIIQGEIFEYGDGFASIEEDIPDHGTSTSGKTLYLHVQALSQRSFSKAVETVETLMNEVLYPKKKIIQRPSPGRSWSKVLQNEYEIQDLMKSTLSHLITNGIIKGEIYQFSGAVVNARGSPYLITDSNQECPAKRPLYLLIQGPDEKALYWAVDKIKKLIREAEELINNDIAQARPVENQLHADHPALPPALDETMRGFNVHPALPSSSNEPMVGFNVHPTYPPSLDEPMRGFNILPAFPSSSNEPMTGFNVHPTYPPSLDEPMRGFNVHPTLPSSSAEPMRRSNLSEVETIAEGLNVTKTRVVEEQSFPPPFMPQLGENVDADIERCVMLVQWLLAHPLLASFMASPPKELHTKTKTFSKKLALTALQSLILYDQYKCSHFMSQKNCHECHIFFCEAQRLVHECCEAVLHSGYDISKLMSVSDYVKDISVDPEEIRVLYDYPLPRNLFYVDNCRLFIDLVINHGLEIDETHIESYLKSTTHWYPVSAYEKLIACTENKRCSPYKNPKTHKYPRFYSLDHHGGLINFHLETIGNASPNQRFYPDADKIPRCKYFPFLRRLSAFSNLHKIIKNRHESAFNLRKSILSQAAAPGVSDSISYSAYKLTQEIRNTTHYESSAHNLHSQPFGMLGEQTGQQSLSNPIKGVAMQCPQIPESSTLPWWSITPQPTLNNPFGGGPPDYPKNPVPFKFPLPENIEPSENKIPPQDQLPQSFTTIREPTANYSRPLGGKSKVPIESRPVKVGWRKRKVLRKIMEQGETNQALETLDKLSVEGGIPGDVQFGSNESPLGVSNRNGAMDPVPPHNVEQGFNWMEQNVMPTMQPMLFGLHKPNTHERKPILKPPVLNVPQHLEGEQGERAGTQLTTGGSQHDPLAEAISKLQEYIEATTTKEPKSVKSESASTSTVGEASDRNVLQKLSDSIKQSVSTMQQTPPTMQNQPESPFGKVIQQLEQFIKSNIGSQECLTSGTLRKDEVLKSNTNEEIVKTKENTTKGLKTYDSSEKECRPTQQKLESGSTEHTSISRTQQKKEFVETKLAQRKRLSSEVNYESSLPKIKKIESSEKPSLNVKQKSNLSRQQSSSPTIASGSISQNLTSSTSASFSVSILGDSLLERARTVWGGSSYDIRKNSYTVSTLTKDVLDVLFTRKILDKYCVVMVGVNDVIQSTSHITLVQELKKLLNILNKKGHYVFLVTIPLYVSNSTNINKSIPAVNGFISSFNTKPNLTIIPFHKLFIQTGNHKKLLKSIYVADKDSVVLSDLACNMLRDLIEKSISEKKQSE